jgi:hypothetical protein
MFKIAAKTRGRAFKSRKESGPAVRRFGAKQSVTCGGALQADGPLPVLLKTACFKSANDYRQETLEVSARKGYHSIIKKAAI